MSFRNTTHRIELALNERHFAWGKRLFATDIDGVLIESDGESPLAIVDYKYENWDEDLTTSPIKTLNSLAARASLPFFIVKYQRDPFYFWIIPFNDLAMQLLPKRQQMTERQWVEWLYSLRGEKAPAGILADLADSRFAESDEWEIPARRRIYNKPAMAGCIF